MRSHYHASIDPEVENNSHSAVLRMIGFNKRVLEAGCASGHVSEVLQSRGCRVVGIEIDAEVARAAEPWVERVVIGNFDDGALWGELAGEEFDAVLFGDVLEHLKNPLDALREAVQHLVPTGMVVISVPNITHADVKIAMIKGQFPYADSGLLDRTHIHFFTKESLARLLQEAGLVATEFFRVSVPVFSTELGVGRDDVDAHVLEALLSDRDAETYQFIVKAVRDDGAKSLEDLSGGLLAMADQLLDQKQRYATLQREYSLLQRAYEVHATCEHDLAVARASTATLRAQYDGDLVELVHLRRQMRKIKRWLPLSIFRFVRKLFATKDRTDGVAGPVLEGLEFVQNHPQKSVDVSGTGQGIHKGEFQGGPSLDLSASEDHLTALE